MSAASPSAPAPSHRALTGIRVLALENFIAGPYATMLMADAGAEVVKVEPPDGGDQARAVPPLRTTAGGEPRSIAFLRANRGKKSVTLDLKSARGREVFLDLARSADVLVENLRPGALARLGLDYPSLRSTHPRLIYVSVTGFGHDDLMPSPYRDRPAFDIVGQAASGLMWRPERDGERPAYLGFPLADLYAATLAYAGALQALVQRGVTGAGQHVDVSLADGAVALNELSIALYGITGTRAPGGIHALAAPFGNFRARDGFIAIAVLGERVWEKFCAAIDRPDLLRRPDLRDGVSRHAHANELRALIEGWLASRDRATAVDRLNEQGVPAAVVQDVDEVFASPQTAARRMLVQVPDPAWGTVMLAGNPIKSSGSPEEPARAAPLLGEHTAQVLRSWASIDAAQCDALRAQGIV